MNERNQSHNTLIGKWPDPISFLTDYKDFAIDTRPLLVKMIVEKHSETTNDREKKLLHMHGIEQFFFFWETLLAFYCASTSEGQIDLYRWLTTSFNDLNQNIKSLDREQLRHLYETEFPRLERDKLEEFIDVSAGISEYLKNTVLPTGHLIPIFNKLKHKSLMYRINDDVSILLSEECERELEEHRVSEKTETAWRQNLSWLIKKVTEHKILIVNAIDITITRIAGQGNTWLSGPGQRAEIINLISE